MTLLCGRYRYVRELGAGATGRVLLAHDEASAGALRALKVVSAQHAAFLSWEFSRLHAVEHPRLARVHELLRLSAAVHELSLPAGSLVLVEDFVAGERWGNYVRSLEGTRAREEAVFKSALGVAEALSVVHDAGLVHGDVKADNVLVQASGEASLIDFGFARAPQLSAPLRGTPRTMAPELYAGVVTHSADVYALGATLYDLLGGGASSTPVRTFSSLPDVSPAWLELIRALTASDPQARPVDGGEAVSLLLVLGKKLGFSAAGQGAKFALSAPVRAPDVLARRVRTLPFVRYGTRVESMCEALFSGQIVVLHGPRGSGRTRLARELLRVFHERCLAQDGATFSCAESLSAVLALPAARVLCVLDPVRADQVEEALRAREACRLAGRELRVLCVSDEPVTAQGVAAFEIERMNEAELRALALRALDRRELPVAELAELMRASAGFPGRACALLERSLAGATSREVGEPDERRLSHEASALLELAAWLPRVLASPARATSLGTDAQHAEPAFVELLAHGLVQLEDGDPKLSAVVARGVRARTRADARAHYAPKLAEERAEAGTEFWLLSREEEACSAWLSEARALRTGHDLPAARDVLEEALSFVADARLRRELAELERAAARYPRALSLLSAVADGEDALLSAELLRLSGDAAGARARLSRLLEASGPLVERATALSARLFFDAGELEAAAAGVTALEHATNLQARAAAAEVATLLALSRGASGREQVEQCVETARELGLLRPLSRALSLRAQVLSRTGERGRALSDAREAAQLAKNADEMHESATFALNLGLLEFEAGEIGRALEALDDAAYRLCMIDRPRDLVRVLYNLGNVALFIGDFARADVVLSEVLARLSGADDALTLAHARLALSELCVVRGAIDEALALLTRALADLPEQVRPSLRALLHARSSQLWLLKENQAAAREQLASALALPLEEDVSASLEVDLARIRSALARSESEQAERLSQTALARAHALTLPDRVRLLLAAIDSARISGDELAAQSRLSLCRALLERVLSGLSPRLRASMRAMPAHARVLESEIRERPALDSSANAERWRSLLRSARRLFDEPSRARLAQRTTELLLELVHAERVLLIMARDGSEMRVLGHVTLQGGAGRGVTLAHGEDRGVAFSRSVVERALLEQAAVLTLEASSDARFDSAQSLHAASVRSVLCVPLSGTPAGVLYLDDRMRGSAFSADDVALVEDLALLASQALRALSERRAQERRARRAEESRDALRTELTRLARTGEGPGSAIVHGSAVMTHLLEVARRVAATDAPVLITGESGTGKELVARFVHAASARRAAPFVAESCAALPETLLESTLFGHVRGAFTGADRARKGLFELADQGTLLLDEVAEMTPTMQAKLLRVLQEGEVRPVGSERTLRVDVRVLFATHRDLEALVRAGQFREDLYYRAAVITLDVPPLRERREDIALLTQHFLHKHGGGRRVSMSPEVLRAFELAPWPGNVRELENQVRRALALGGERIELSHIEHAAPPSLRVDELDLHAQTELLTRTLVEQALSRAAGNLTQAAELLGITRFGLQKMVKRLGLGPYVGRHRK